MLNPVVCWLTLKVMRTPLLFNHSCRGLPSHVLHQSTSVCHQRRPFSSCYGQPCIVGVTYHNLVGFSAVAILGIQQPNTTFSMYEPLPYAILALVMMFYPLSGFIADICCGRLKAVIISLICILPFFIIMLVAISLLVSISKPDIPILQIMEHNLGIAYVIVILAIISLLAFIIGLAGYQANFIQLGLDQLFEAPSHYLVLFIPALCYVDF